VHLAGSTKVLAWFHLLCLNNGLTGMYFEIGNQP
jgi:hypothetical protein